LYEQNAIGKTRSALWLQLAQLGLHGTKPQILRFGKLVTNHLYAGWCWISYVLLAGITGLALYVLPNVRRRWRVMHHAARLLAKITGTPLYVTGVENLPDDRACVLVANHASYLDGYVLVGAIPAPFSFIAKAELKQKPLVYGFLKRIGTLFVERLDTQQAAEDAKRIANVAGDKQATMFFPEGTFKRMPGILPFRMGAFVTAVESNVPVVPIAIRGTRYILRADSWFPRRGHISVSIGAPLYPDTACDSHEERWASAVMLRDQTRQYILQHCREPDLVNP
jgi:1-acyl-sn-glycerol-3-phosphate acyltransferase